MSKALPLISPEISPDNLPDSGYPTELVDAMVGVDANLNDPSSDYYKAWSEQVEAAGGPEIFTGLQFEVPNISKGKPGASGSRYEVQGVEIHTGRKSEYERTGHPGIFNPGAQFYAGRKAVLNENVPTSEPVYTVTKYSSSGELEDIRHCKQADLIKIAGFASDWGMRQERPEQAAAPGNTREVRLNTNFGTKDPFDHISQQLEAEGVSSFAGLRWEEVQPERDGERAVHSVEATMDTPLTDDHASHRGIGKGSRHEPSLTRAMVLQERDDKDAIVAERILKGKAIGTYFKKRGEQIKNIRLEIPEQAEVIDIATRRTAQRLEEEMVWDEAATLAYLLSYGDMMDTEVREADNDIKKEMAKVTRSEEGQRRMNALRELIKRHGMVNIYATAVELRDQFLESALRLRLPTKFSDPLETKEKNGSSLSFALENLADRHYYGTHKPEYEMAAAYEGVTLGDPFVSVRGSHTIRSRQTHRTQRLRQEVVWEELGWSLVSQTIHKNVDREIVDIKEPSGEPVYMKKVEVHFLETPLAKLPELTRDEAKAAEEEVFRAIEAGKPAPRAALIHLGRVMERGVTRAPLMRLEQTAG